MTTKEWAETIQAIVTSVGIVIAGLWTYFNVILGRVFSPNLQINFLVKQTINIARTHVAIITIDIKNAGKTRIAKSNCYISTAPIKVDTNSSPLSRLDIPLDFNNNKLYEVFQTHNYFEPNESATEDVLISINESGLIKIGLIFLDKTNKLWSSTSIIKADKIKERK